MAFLKASSNLLSYLTLDGQVQAPPLIVPTHLPLLALHLLAARALASKYTSEQCQKKKKTPNVGHLHELKYASSHVN